MRQTPRVESTRKGHDPDAGFPSGSRAVAAFCAGLAPTSQLDPGRIEALAAHLAAEAISADPNQHGSEVGRQRRPLPTRWRRRAAFTTLMSSLVAKIGLASVALAATTGGLAASGSLPEPAQQAVSEVASRIGISIPSPSAADVDDVVDAADLDSLGSDDGPALPEPAADRAKWVVEAVFDEEGDPVEDGVEFGKRVAETAVSGQGEGRGEGHPAGEPGPPGDGPTPSPPDGVGDLPPVDPSPPIP